MTSKSVKLVPATLPKIAKGPPLVLARFTL
jgi:hypothetical protein